MTWLTLSKSLQLLFCLFPPPSTFLTRRGSDVLWSQQTLAQSHAFCCKLIGSPWVVGCMRPSYLKGDVVVQSLSHVKLFVTPWTAARQASLSITNSRSLLKLMSTESVMPSNHLILCHPLFFLPPIPPSIRVFSNESTLHMR